MSDSKYAPNIKCVVAIQLGDVGLDRQPSGEWYSDRDDRMPLIRIGDENGSWVYYALNKVAVDALLACCQKIRELPVQKPRNVFQVERPRIILPNGGQGKVGRLH